MSKDGARQVGEDIEEYRNRLAEQVEDIFITAMDTIAADGRKVEEYRYNAGLDMVYNLLFRYNPRRRRAAKTVLDYKTDSDSIEAVLDIYISLTYKYGFRPSVHGFSVMTGIPGEVIEGWGKGINDNSYLFTRLSNISREWLINKLSSTSLGIVTLAEKEKEFGLLYAYPSIGNSQSDRVTVTPKEIEERRRLSSITEPPQKPPALITISDSDITEV